MLKRLEVRQLKLGMFVHELCGPWIDHPFWRSSMRLDDPKTLQQIIDSKVKEVWIDTSKGLDLIDEKAERKSEIETPLAPQKPAPAATTRATSLEEEMGR